MVALTVEELKLEYADDEEQMKLLIREMEFYCEMDKRESEMSYEEVVHSCMLEDDYGMAPCGHYLLRHSRDTLPFYLRPKPHPIPADDLFLEKLGNAQVRWTTQHSYPKHVIESLAKDTLALLLWKHGNDYPPWHAICKDSAHQPFYPAIIKAAATAACFWLPQVSLYKMGCKSTFENQLAAFWDELEALHFRSCTLDDVCKLFIESMADNRKYAFFTESDLADRFNECWTLLEVTRSSPERREDEDTRPPLCFRRPIKFPFPKKDKEKDEVFFSITKIVREMESWPTNLEANEHIVLMLELLREECTLKELDLIETLVSTAKDGNMDCHDLDILESTMSSLSCPLSRFFHHGKRVIQRQLLSVVQPLFILCNPKHTHITEIVEVGEVRRTALGNRFIGRSHLLWAFYQLGYALPPKIRNLIDVNSADEDHPPYHIYKAAMILTAASEEEETLLEHFMFAVIYSKDIGSDGYQVIKMLQEFYTFREVLESSDSDTSDHSDEPLQTESSHAELDNGITNLLKPNPSENSSSDFGDTLKT